ncbi:potassium channel family protein [Rhizobium alvei]|uniref:Potassium channel family protein n=1 Tax=Rhizobium alvei TaxID=1132659 RepID=A0ABT8YS92_9HYPH|nr:potassium channel family protein [Rhizobium alvei]MDO6966536.1 potassium channel family protein [Rhizobium alvei]
MVSFGFALVRLLKGLIRGFRDPDFRALLFVLALVLLGGTLFYHQAEGWSWVDSLYRSTMILATITPEGFVLTSDMAKLFTVVYVIAGLGVMISFAVTLGRHIAQPSAIRKYLSEKMDPSDEG